MCKMGTRIQSAIVLLATLLIVMGFTVTDCSAQSTSDPTSKQAPENRSTLNDNESLEWLPGLDGQPVQPSNRPAAAPALPNARPLNPSNSQRFPSDPAALYPNQPVVAQVAFQETASTQQDPQTQTDQATTTPAPAQNNVVDSRITMVTKGVTQLPSEAGQVWRTYDISPYTTAVRDNQRPQQAIIDWILKETGTEMWFQQPMGILNTTGRQLHVYHTPAVQARVKSLVDRFVNSRARSLVMGMKMMTITSPDWRSSAFSMMQPVPMSSPGVEAWLMSKENAAILFGDLKNRADSQERTNADLVVTDGQPYELSQRRPVTFTRSVSASQTGAGYTPLNSQIAEGFTVDISALSSLDGRSIEAIIGCDIDQIEKMNRVSVDLPGIGGQTQPFELQIPQMVSWSVKERFRWPSDQVLVLSCGVVATPGPQRQALLGLPTLFNGNRRRADALMFLEYKGVAQSVAGVSQTQLLAPTGLNRGYVPPQSTPTGNITGNTGQAGLIPITPRR